MIHSFGTALAGGVRRLEVIRENIAPLINRLRL